MSPRKTTLSTLKYLSPVMTCGLVPWIGFLDHHLAASRSCWEIIPALAPCSSKVPGTVGRAPWWLWCLLPHSDPARQHLSRSYSKTWGLRCAWPHGSHQSWLCPANCFWFLTQTPWALAHCSSRPRLHGFPKVKSLALSFGSPLRAKLLTNPKYLSEPCLTGPPRIQGSLGAVSSPSRNIGNSLDVLPPSKCPTFSLPLS